MDEVPLISGDGLVRVLWCMGAKGATTPCVRRFTTWAALGLHVDQQHRPVGALEIYQTWEEQDDAR